MGLPKKILAASVIVLMGAVLDGCANSLIEVRKGSERITLADESQVSGCQSKGAVTVSVLAKVGFFNRSVEEVDANLLQLASNDAVDAGGDTLVKGERPEIGKRTFAIYKCRP